MPLESLPENRIRFTADNANAGSVAETFGGVKTETIPRRSGDKDVLGKKRGGLEGQDSQLVVDTLGSDNRKAKDKLTRASIVHHYHHHHHHHHQQLQHLHHLHHQESSLLRRREEAEACNGSLRVEEGDDHQVDDECGGVVRIFPPPLPSLARKSPSQFPCQMPLVALQRIRSHGRFVLQELKVPKQLMFRPIRTNGRLILQLKYDEGDEAEHEIGAGIEQLKLEGCSSDQAAAATALPSTPGESESSSSSSSLLETTSSDSSTSTPVISSGSSSSIVSILPVSPLDAFCQGPCGGREIVVESTAGLEHGTKA